MQFTKQFEGTFAQVKEQIDKFVAEGGHIDAGHHRPHWPKRLPKSHTFMLQRCGFIAICRRKKKAK